MASGDRMPVECIRRINQGLKFEFYVQERLVEFFTGKGMNVSVIVGGGCTGGVDVKVRGLNEWYGLRWNIECKLNDKALFGQTTLKILSDGTVDGVSERSKAVVTLIDTVNVILKENGINGRSACDVANQTCDANITPTKNYIRKSEDNITPGKPLSITVLCIGKNDDGDPLFYVKTGMTMRVRLRRKNRGITAVLEKKPNTPKLEGGMTIDELFTRLTEPPHLINIPFHYQ